MKLLLLEFRLLKEDLLKISLLILGISILNYILFSGDKMISSRSTTNDVLSLLFGSADHFPLEWINWILLCFGYFILLQMVWKLNLHTISVFQVLRYKNIRLFWQTKFIIGFLLTLCYVFFNLLIAFIISLFLNVQLIWDFRWIVVFCCLSLNLYIHALLWFAIKIYSSVEVAIITVCFLFYAGVRIIKPFIPLYYSMKDHVNQYLPLTFLIELTVIFLLLTLILLKAKRMDLH
jgi:hypothetical protein